MLTSRANELYLREGFFSIIGTVGDEISQPRSGIGTRNKINGKCTHRGVVNCNAGLIRLATAGKANTHWQMLVSLLPLGEGSGR